MDCEYSGTIMVPPRGFGDNGVLVVGEIPHWTEVREGQAFSGTEGTILSSELSRAGLHIHSCRLTYIWPHRADEKEDKHFDHHLAQLIGIMRKYDKILLMGAVNANTFADRSINDVAGLEFSETAYIKKPVSFAPNPFSAKYGSFGEFRLSLEKAVDRWRDM